MRIRYPRYSLEEILQILRKDSQRLGERLPLKLVTLFGSWAKGRATASSDIDVLVVYEGPRREDAYKIASETLHLRGVEPHIYSEGEFDLIARHSPRTKREWVEEAIIIMGKCLNHSCVNIFDH